MKIKIKTYEQLLEQYRENEIIQKRIKDKKQFELKDSDNNRIVFYKDMYNLLGKVVDISSEVDNGKIADVQGYNWSKEWVLGYFGIFHGVPVYSKGEYEQIRKDPNVCKLN